jgi:NAD(P)-dependent dehydrogenase (short-subunit alcohol dehydrogenase family)
MTHSSNLPLDGTTAITGGASGIGLAIAKTFAAPGALVMILESQLRAHGGSRSGNHRIGRQGVGARLRSCG